MPAERNSYAYFKVKSALPLRQIESHLGGLGDGRCWSIGDKRANNKSRYQFSEWSLLSGIERGRPVDEHLQSLWRRMSKYREKIIQLPLDMERSVACVGHFDTHRDKFQVSCGHFKTAAYYRVKLDWDFYFCDDFGSEEEGRPYWSW